MAGNEHMEEQVYKLGPFLGPGWFQFQAQGQRGYLAPHPWCYFCVTLGSYWTCPLLAPMSVLPDSGGSLLPHWLCCFRQDPASAIGHACGRFCPGPPIRFLARLDCNSSLTWVSLQGSLGPNSSVSWKAERGWPGSDCFCQQQKAPAPHRLPKAWPCWRAHWGALTMHL